MKQSEIKILKDPDFVRRLFNYTHEEVERICTAWEDTDKDSYDSMADKSFSEEFEKICLAIMRAREEAGL